MVVPLAAAAIVLLGIIAVVSGVVLVSAYRRDIATAESEESIVVTTDSTVETVLNNDDLSAAEKVKVLKEYLDTLDTTTPGTNTDIEKYLPYIIIGFVLLLISRG